MARVTSDAQIDMTQPNFNSFLAGQYKSNFVHDITVAGITYKDVLEVLSTAGDVLYDNLFAGPSIQINSTGPTATIVGGTLTGLITLVWDGAAYVPSRLIDGINIPAVSAYQAYTTPTNTDDVAVLQSALQGNDV